MNLNDDIMAIRKGIREGLFSNEASVSQGIVLRILQSLGWPTYDTQIVWPEFSLEGKRVDFALCHPEKSPRIFIEVKNIGKHNTGKAEKQLFEYAFHLGIPMAILTDGPEWHFFLPAEQGHYQERRVYKLDLLERDSEEIVQRFKRYLQYESVCTASALQAAKDDYQDVKRQREIEEFMPRAWDKLITEPDDLLVELIIEKVESLCGYKPDESLVASFLSDNDLASKPFRDRPTKLPVDKPSDVGSQATPTDFKEDKGVEGYRSPFDCVDRRELPAGLADILEICLEVYENGRGYNAAVRALFERRKLRSIHTIYDKCTRAIELDTAGFKELLAEKARISGYLQSRHPKYEKEIRSCLGD